MTAMQCPPALNLLRKVASVRFVMLDHPSHAHDMARRRWAWGPSFIFSILAPRSVDADTSDRHKARAHGSHPPPLTPAVIAEHGLSPRSTSSSCRSWAGRRTLTELGIFSVMWSEHCSYKSSRVQLKKLPTKAPWVIQGPGENAGVIDIGDGLAAIFKMESHNHPSFIEPYQGAATGVGGIMRDVFTMGARPIANAERAALRRARRSEDPPPDRRRGRRHRRLRQLHGRADRRRAR